MVESPPVKRQRTDSNANVSSEITRVEQFWLKDGNIILQVESSQFRVHKSVLAMHSNIFKDLFDVPQPEQELLIEGCPVVHLSDSAEDMEHILSLVYKGFNFISDWTEDCEPSVFMPPISAMVRLGRKYEFTRFQADALSYLKKSFPNSLKKWLHTTDRFPSAVLFNVINLAHETSITSILPAAYLDVCYNCSLEMILQGVDDIAGQRVRLNSYCMERCIIGREKLFYHLPKSIFPWLSDDEDSAFSVPCDTCTNESSCDQSLSGMLWMAWTKSMEGCRLAFLVGPEDLRDRFCINCTAKTMDEYEKGRKSLWNELPGFFGLPQWHKLKDFETLQVGQLVQ